MTALAGGTGNAATQSLTVVVRGIATGEINPRQVFGVVLREAQVGLYVGLVSGAVLAVFAFLWQGAPLLGIVVGASLTASILVSTILGSFVPIIIKHLGADPALASGPFIATIMDITSMFVYFTLATLILLP
jgi:magnesium transporter